MLFKVFVLSSFGIVISSLVEVSFAKVVSIVCCTMTSKCRHWNCMFVVTLLFLEDW